MDPIEKKKLKLSLEERQKLWHEQDKELESYCRYPTTEDERNNNARPVVVDAPDPWVQALTYVSIEEKRRARGAWPKKAVKKPTKKSDVVPKEFRLQAADIEALRFYFNDFGGFCGLKSNYHASIECYHECSRCGHRYVEGSSKKCPNCRKTRGEYSSDSEMRVKAGHQSAWHSNLDLEIIGIVGSKEMERANMVRDALVSMVDTGLSIDVTVLYKVYGPQNPFAPFMVWGQLAQLADMTPPAERGAKKYNTTPREYLEKHIRGDGGRVLEMAVKMSAEQLLANASHRYLKHK